MITIFVDNEPRQVRPDQNLLQACLSLGFDLPYFCWHPALHAVGACRQCAVKQFKDEHDTRGKIIMSCMTPVAEGMRISVNDPEARAFRTGIVEYLMLNHPHDCPVCDEGGECHLQDVTVMTGHHARRNRFRKRTHRNQDLGPFIGHEMNRCIQCYRCIRFYRDLAGGRDLHVFGSHDHVYFGRHDDGCLESPFSGNLVEICPTGVFTDRPLKKHYARKWDLQTAPSVCVHCGLGCNTIVGERSGTVRRILNRFNHEVNGYFLCDRGRFGYGFVNSEQRVRSSAAADSPPGDPVAVKEKAALALAASALAGAKGIIGIGSPRASLESNYALRQLVGPENFHAGISDREHELVAEIIGILRSGLCPTPSLRQVAEADAVLVLGEDVTNTAPLLALSVRQAVRTRAFETADRMKIPRWHDAAVRNAAQDIRSPLFIASASATELDGIAARTLRLDPRGVARLGFAVAHALDPAAPEPAGLDETAAGTAREIAAALLGAKRPIIVSGTGCLSRSVVRAAANIARGLRHAGVSAQLAYAVPECNTLGLGLLGGRTLDEAFNRMHDGIADTVVILENDLSRRAAAGAVDAFLSQARQVIVIDHHENATTARAKVLLPAATFAEATGTLVNSEGRAQRSFQVFVPQGMIRASWQWIDAIMGALHRRPDGAPARALDGLIDELVADLPFFAPVRTAAPPAAFRVLGRKLPRQPHRFSGRTAMTADVSVREPKPAGDSDTPLDFTMEGADGAVPAALVSRYWSPGWNSVQALNKFQQEVGGPMQGGDAGQRLIEPAGPTDHAYFPVPQDEEPADRDCPHYDIFTSEELSALAPDIRKRASLNRR